MKPRGQILRCDACTYWTKQAGKPRGECNKFRNLETRKPFVTLQCMGCVYGRPIKKEITFKPRVKRRVYNESVINGKFYTHFIMDTGAPILISRFPHLRRYDYINFAVMSKMSEILDANATIFCGQRPSVEKRMIIGYINKNTGDFVQ